MHESHDHHPGTNGPDSRAPGALAGTPSSSDATLLRALADDELNPAEVDAARSGDASGGPLDAQVDFERSLRTSVARTMGRTTAPDGLRERIAAAMAHADADAPAAAGEVERPHILARLFHGPRHADWLAVAAVVALVAGVIGFSMLVPKVDDLGGGAAGGPSIPLTVTEAASFAVQEHISCGDAQTRERKFGAHAADEDAAVAMLADHLDVAPNRLAVPDLSHLGYEFRGVGGCRMPGCSSNRSCHLLYVHESGGMMSVFVAKEAERYGAGSCERSCNTTGRRVLKVEQNGLAWFFVCCREKDLDEASLDFLAAVDHI